MDAVDAVRRARVVAARQDDVVTRADLVECRVSGALLRMLLRSGSWARLYRGSYLLEPHRAGFQLQRSWARAAVLVEPGSVASHHTAAVLLGIRGVPRTGVVHVTRPTKVDGRPGLVSHQGLVGPDDVVDLAGLRVTAAERTLADLVPALPRLEALAVLDSALFRKVATVDDVRRAQQRVRGRRGSLHVRDLWGEADGRAESPLESRIRLCCIDGGLRPSNLQLEITGPHGVGSAYADLAFDVERLLTSPAAARAGLPRSLLATARRDRRTGLVLPVLAEADGREPHGQPDVLAADRYRQNAVLARDYPLVRVMWVDTYAPERIIRMVLAAVGEPFE